jgi:hypothetical protein
METANPLILTATRLANQDPSIGPAGEYLDIAIRVLAAATRMSISSIQDRLDEIACATNGDRSLTPMRHVTSVDVARVWLNSLTTFPTLPPVEQRELVAQSVHEDVLLLWQRVRRSWPMEVPPMLKGSHHSPESRALMKTANLANIEQRRAAALAQWANPQTRAAMCASMRREDTCRRGHSRTSENTFIYKNGDRECRPCRRMVENARLRARYAERKTIRA